MKKLVCPSTSGIASELHQANACVTGWCVPAVSLISTGMAAAPDGTPLILSVAFSSRHSRPKATPRLQGSTFTSAPVSSSAGRSIKASPTLSRTGSVGLWWASKGNNMTSRSGLKLGNQGLGSPRLKDWRCQMIFLPCIHHFKDIGLVHFQRQHPNDFQLLGQRKIFELAVRHASRLSRTNFSFNL